MTIAPASNAWTPTCRLTIERPATSPTVPVRATAGGRPQTAGEPRRLEHLERFVDRVARTLAPDEDLLILGPGTVRERLERHVRAMDERHQGAREVTCKASTRLTDRQLVARLRVLAGDEPRAQTVGAYRWSEPAPRRPSGQAQPGPRRVVEKPPRDVGRRA